MTAIVFISVVLTGTFPLIMRPLEVEGRVYRCHHNLTGVHPQRVLACEPPGFCKPHKTEFINDSLGVCRCPTGTPGCPILVKLTERCEEDGPDVMYKCENRFENTECRIVNRSLGQTWGDCACIPGFVVKVPLMERRVHYMLRERDCEGVYDAAANPLPASPFFLRIFLTLYFTETHLANFLSKYLN